LGWLNVPMGGIRAGNMIGARMRINEGDNVCYSRDRTLLYMNRREQGMPV
jgi:hypothetical protein